MNSDIQSKDIINALLPVTAMYCLWCIASLMLLFIGHFFPQNEVLQSIIIPISAIFFIALASISTGIFMVYQTGYFIVWPKLRYSFLLFTIILAAVFFILNRSGGKNSNFLFVLGTANLLVFANLIGSWIVGPLKRPVELVPVCFAMSLADLFSVLVGPTKKMAERIEEFYKGGLQGQIPAVDFLLIKIAAPGTEYLLPIFGVADWIIIAFFAAVVVKFEMDDNLIGNSLGYMVKKKQINLYFPVAALGLTVAVLIAQLSTLFIPALPVIIVIFLSYLFVKYPQTRMLKKSDWLLMLYFFLAMMVGVVLVIFT